MLLKKDCRCDTI